MTALEVVVGSVAWLVCIIAAGSIGRSARRRERGSK